MNRVRILIIFILLFVIALFDGCSDKNTQNAIKSNSVQKKYTDSEKSIGFNAAFDLLNNSELLDMYSDDSFYGFQDKSIEEYKDNSKQKFSVVKYNGNVFPRSLISLMENALYNKDYDDEMKKLEAGNYRVNKNKFIKKNPALYDSSVIDDITDVYQINFDKNKKYYVIVIKGGSSGTYYIDIRDLSGRKIYDFETANYGDCNIIKYDGNYYYIYQEENFDFRFNDSIVIYKLEPKHLQSIRISFIPEYFTWKNVYNKQESNIKLSDYICGIKDNLVNGDYIDRGKVSYSSNGKYYGGIGCFNNYKGDETEVKDVDNISYSINFGNIGFPVYFSKGLNSTGTINMNLHLTGEFYMYDSKSQSYKELSNLNLANLYRADKNKELMQIWFKAINKKIYMFRIFHLINYSYILNVSLIDQGKVNQVRNDIIIPQNSITLLEGKQFINF